MRRDLLLRARELAWRESGLTVVVTARADGSFPATVVNAAVLDHPVTGELVVGFVARRSARKLANLRARPQITVLFRSGWEWVAVEGSVALAGPDDPLAGLQSSDLPALVSAIYAAAVGGTVDEWSKLDAMFVDEGHTAVLVQPSRVYSNSEPS